MQIDSITGAASKNTYQKSENKALHFKEALAFVSSDQVADEVKESALQTSFINWRNEYSISGINAGSHGKR